MKAVALAESGREDEAYAAFGAILNKDFNDARALYGLAQLYRRSENYGMAFNLYRMGAGLEQKPSSAYYNGMGLCFEESWDLDNAEKCFKRALEVDPRNVEAYSNMGLVYLLRCQPKEALKLLAIALEIDPDFAAAKHHQAYANLMLRNWAAGWDGHQEILGKIKTRSERFYEGDTGLLPRWDGTPGQSVLVYGEQGIGDEISFASCIPDLQKISREVVFDCDHRLEGLFKRSFRGVHVYGTRFKAPSAWLDNHRIDARVAIGDLPRFFRREAKDFPGTGYLQADPERRIQWSSLFDTFRKPVIGITWTGGLQNTGSFKRSLEFEQILPILKSIDATWISLEYRDRSAEIDRAKAEGVNIRSFDRYTGKSEVQDYDDVAAIVASVDMVLSVTTAVIHLAGALGKECWCLAPSRPRWFYGLEGDLDWYKSVKMFRQSQDGTWPLAEVEKLLRLRYT